MKNVVRLATVDPHEDSRNALKNMLLGIDTVWLEAECSRYEFFLDVVQQTQTDIALVSLDADPEKGLQLIAEVTAELPTCSVLVVSSSQEGSLILRAMRNGAKEFLNLPIKLEDFMSAMVESARREAPVVQKVMSRVARSSRSPASVAVLVARHWLSIWLVCWLKTNAIVRW